MAAALTHGRKETGDGLSATRPARDLYQIAELVERCFESDLDSQGRAAIREMKAVGRLGPILWLISLLDFGGELGLGYVWRARNSVIGNVSLYGAGMHPYLGRGSLIANVAVDPDYRRRGIARALMQAAIECLAERRNRWIILQVEADNHGAIQLYESLGFIRYETLVHWEARRAIVPSPDIQAASVCQVKRHTRDDALAEADLIFNRARRGAMSWTRPITRGMVLRNWPLSLDNFASQGGERWVLPDPARPDDLLASVWMESPGWRRVRVTYFGDPALDTAAQQSLLAHGIARALTRSRHIQLETTAESGVDDSFFTDAGFRRVRRLIQMRLMLNER